MRYLILLTGVGLLVTNSFLGSVAASYDDRLGIISLSATDLTILDNKQTTSEYEMLFLANKMFTIQVKQKDGPTFNFVYDGKAMTMTERFPKGNIQSFKYDAASLVEKLGKDDVEYGALLLATKHLAFPYHPKAIGQGDFVGKQTMLKLLQDKSLRAEGKSDALTLGLQNGPVWAKFDKRGLLKQFEMSDSQGKVRRQFVVQKGSVASIPKDEAAAFVDTTRLFADAVDRTKMLQVLVESLAKGQPTK